MNTLRSGSTATRPLEALGIDEMEERAYRALLGHRLATVEDLASLLAVSLRKAQRLVNTIESKGLASHSPEKPRRYMAAPPELAVEAMARQRQADIERARSTIPELKLHVTNDPEADDQEQIVEIISSRAALDQILTQLRRTIQTEAIGFQRPPVILDTADNGLDYAGRPVLPKGVRVRTVSDEAYLALPGALESLRRDTALGEELRIFPALPLKMVVFDRRIGLIPLNPSNPASPSLLVRASSLLDALYSLFELIWERSTPIAFNEHGNWSASASSAQLSEATGQVVSLLAAGLNDKAIAHELGISAATLNRRVAELMKGFGTRSRFQLGWRAALEAFPERLPDPPARGRQNPRRNRST